MKKMNILCKRSTLLSVIFMLWGLVLSAQTVTDKRYRSETFAVTQESSLEIENKYGTILVVPWNKDSIQVSVDMFFEAKNYSKLRKMKDDVEIVFKGGGNYLIAKTEIGDGGSKIVSEIRALSNTLNTNSALEVNYTVYIPEYINLILTNKFGDIYIDDIYGDINISLSNGVLKANRFYGNSDIELLFARGEIREMGTTSLYLSYAELEIQNIAQLDLISKSSDLRIDTATVVKISSRRDKLFFGEVEYLYGNSSFSDLIVTDFIREADCTMKYGKLNVDNVLPEFSRINIESDYTDITLFFNADCNYNLDIEHSSKAVLMMPNVNADLERRRIGEEMMSVGGTVGKDKADSNVRIKANQKCYIKLSSR